MPIIEAESRPETLRLPSKPVITRKRNEQEIIPSYLDLI